LDSVLSLLGNIATMIFFSFKDITEEEIENNIKYLEQEKWFQAYLNNDKYNKLIANNTTIRKVIGSININKMSKPNYHKRQQIRVEKVINKQTAN